MKPIALLVFFFLLFAFTTTAKFVLDSDGDPLVSGGKYYFKPHDSVGGGDIFDAAIRRGTTQYCNLGVVQYEGGVGRETTVEVKFAFNVQTDRPLSISTAYLPPNICTNTSKWLVIESEPLGKAVMVGDAKEFLEPVVNGWFKIKAYHSKYYKLVFCTKSDNCGDIGTRIDKQGYRRLVVTDEKPLVFKFHKIRSVILAEQEEARKLNVV